MVRPGVVLLSSLLLASATLAQNSSATKFRTPPGKLFAIAARSQGPGAETGSIEGTVIDASGRPVAGATVFAGTLAKSPRAQTDGEGKFKLEGLPAGIVGLQAFKESDGYPYNLFSFFLMPGEQLPKFDLLVGQTLTNVVIRLGAKAAYLRVHIRDENGLPISAGLLFSRPDLGQYGDYQRSSKGDDLILVPPVPFRLTVEEKGFRLWRYGEDDQQKGGDLITLRSGQTLRLTITLKKSE
jgi:hypothetical protein